MKRERHYTLHWARMRAIYGTTAQEMHVAEIDRQGDGTIERAQPIISKCKMQTLGLMEAGLKPHCHVKPLKCCQTLNLV